MQAIEAHDLAKAEESSLRVDAELWQASQQLKDSAGAQGQRVNAPEVRVFQSSQLMPDALLQPLINNLSVMSLELRGSVLIAKKQTRRWQKAVRAGRAGGEGARLSGTTELYSASR